MRPPLPQLPQGGQPACAAPRRAGVTGTLLVLAAAGYAAWASGTRPFTAPADVAVSVPSALFAAALLLQRRWPAGPWRRLPADRPVREGGAVLWVVVIALLVGVELASYFHGGPRADYPTISSAQDALFHARAARAVGWLVWLVVGWYLARR